MTPQQAYEKRYSRQRSEAAQGVQNLWLTAWTIAWVIAEGTEREACAAVCDAASEPRKGYGQTDEQWAAATLAERIRARSNT